MHLYDQVSHISKANSEVIFVLEIYVFFECFCIYISLPGSTGITILISYQWVFSHTFKPNLVHLSETVCHAGKVGFSVAMAMYQVLRLNPGSGTWSSRQSKGQKQFLLSALPFLLFRSPGGVETLQVLSVCR